MLCPGFACECAACGVMVLASQKSLKVPTLKVSLLHVLEETRCEQAFRRGWGSSVNPSLVNILSQSSGEVAL